MFFDLFKSQSCKNMFIISSLVFEVIQGIFSMDCEWKSLSYGCIVMCIVVFIGLWRWFLLQLRLSPLGYHKQSPGAFMKGKSTADTHFCRIDNPIFIVVKVKLNDETQAEVEKNSHASPYFLLLVQYKSQSSLYYILHFQNYLFYYLIFNGRTFSLYKSKRSWSARVLGETHFILDLPHLQSRIQERSRLLWSLCLFERRWPQNVGWCPRKVSEYSSWKQVTYRIISNLDNGRLSWTKRRKMLNTSRVSVQPLLEHLESHFWELLRCY